ncbi:MAG: serine hydroxymethyltransferase [Candidatus Micrarchaeota archaeon]|nr:serine hydroxymethyltransferase [Candidatus Micrarchaeota archaeon]
MQEFLKQVDPEIYGLARQELERQRNGLELIPSENFASLAVMQAQGSVLTNKYSEGYPGKRYYGGNQFIDECETLAINRAKKIFHADHANVQPHSGSQANMAAYFALLNPGDKIMGLNLSHGGHLTHGSQVNFSGKLYKVVPYNVHPKTHLLDFDEIEKLAVQEKPRLIVAGFTAYPRQVDFKRFAEIAQKVGAYFMVDMAHIAGLIAGGAHPQPFPYADVVTSTTHKTLRGPRGAFILCKKEFQEKIDKAVFPGIQGGPFDHVIAAKAVCFKEAMQPEFAQYAKKVVENAKALAESLVEEGMTLVSGGTDTHLIVVDLTSLKITGKEAQNALDEVGITVNKNTIPYDPLSPFVTSGIRLGTPALTTRGMGKSQMKEIGKMISEICRSPNDSAVKERVRKQVAEMTRQFPLYPELG